MKQKKSTELLLTSRMVQRWDNSLDKNIDEILDFISKLEKATQSHKTTIDINLYKKRTAPTKHNSQKSAEAANRPFQFQVFCN